MRSTIFVVALLIAGPVLAQSAVPGDTAPEWRPHFATASGCSTVDSLLAPPGEDSHTMAPALWRLRACPAAAGRALAAALRALRTSGDTAALERATWLAHDLHDGALYDAAREVAADASATPWARVAALRVLLWTKAPSHYVSLPRLLERPVCGGCASTYTMHYYNGGPLAGPRYRWPVFGRELPAGYVARIDALAASLAVDPAGPAMVRAAAAYLTSVPAETRELRGR